MDELQRNVQALPPEQRLVAERAYTESLRTTWIFFVACSAVGVGIGLLIGKKVLSKTHEKQRTGLAQQETDRLEREQAKKEKRISGAAE